jgi:hypothetical protein
MSLLLVLFLLQAPGPQPVPYFDPQGRIPSTFEEFSATVAQVPCRMEVAGRAEADGGFDNLVLVFVNAGLQAAIQSELDTYVADLADEGFSSKVIAVAGGRPEDLRQCLQAHQDSGLVGTMMVGDMPVAWLEGSSRGEDFPIDLFFTDLDGVFSDPDGDGKYESHTGNRAPDIWMGRLYASRLTYQTEEQAIRSYFQRNHAYRTGQLSIPHRGLVYNEVTWYPNDHDMSYLYDDITMYNDENTTTAHHYKSQLRLGFEFVHLIAHSSPWVHTFFLDNEVPGGGSVFNFEIPALAPNAAFYFLNACMCARYTEKDNLGNWYLFAQPWAQGVIASTELMYGVGSLRTVYLALGNDSCIGAAFLAWHKTTYAMYMGTCLLGDPTLRINDEAPTVAPVRVHRPAGPGASVDWAQYAVDTTDFVNGNPDIDARGAECRIVFDSGRKVRADTYWSWFTGSGFAPAESVAWHEYYDVFPACVTDSAGRFWVVWQTFRDYNSGYDHFQLVSSYYHNGTWSSPARVGELAGYHDVQAAIDAGTGDRVWCAFKSWRYGQADVWVSSSEHGGAWATPTRLTEDSLGQISPCVAVDSDDLPWVFWTSLTAGRWHVQGRHHDGSSWLPAFDLDTAGINYCPRAVGGPDGTVWICWYKWTGTQADIYYSCWNGSDWIEPQPVTDDEGDDILPDICIAPGGTPWVCWQSDRSGYWDVYASFYQDGWSTPQSITADQAHDYDPVICPDDNGVWIAWASDRRDYWNIYAAYTDLSGVEERPVTARAQRVTASPNPFRRSVEFRGPDRFTVDVHSADGRLVAKVEGTDGRACWKPADLAAGLYVARVRSGEENGSFKLILARVD